MLEEKFENQSTHQLTTYDEMKSIFSFKRSNSTLPSQSILIKFSTCMSQSANENVNEINIIPKFNTDRKFYTPSFILSSEQLKYQKNDDAFQMIHNRKLEEMTEQKEQILVPKPSKANSYCCICKTSFEDYLAHICLVKHRQLMKKSVFCKFIQDICDTVNGKVASNKDDSYKNLQKSKQIHLQKSKEIVAKKKKIIKIVSSSGPKRGRGRPRKQASKLQRLVAIATDVSISI